MIDTQIKYIANYIFLKFNCEIMGQIQSQHSQNPNGYKIYQTTLLNYIKQFGIDTKFAMSEIKEMHAIYIKKSSNFVTEKEFIENFTFHFSFEEVFRKLKGHERIIIMIDIIKNVCIEYSKYLAQKDYYLFFKTEITQELAIKLTEYIVKQINNIGVIKEYEVYNPSGKVVALELFERVRKKYEKLKTKQEQLEEFED